MDVELVVCVPVGLRDPFFLLRPSDGLKNPARIFAAPADGLSEPVPLPVELVCEPVEVEVDVVWPIFKDGRAKTVAPPMFPPPGEPPPPNPLLPPPPSPPRVWPYTATELHVAKIKPHTKLAYLMMAAPI